MRRLALIFAVLFACLTLPAYAATLTATPQTLATVWAKVKDGDTMKWVGTFPDVQLRGYKFAKRVTWDATKATVGRVYVVGQENLTVRGGKWASLRFDNCAKLSAFDARFEGEPEPRNDTGLRFISCTDVTAERNAFKSLNDGLDVTSVTGFVLSHNTFDDMRGDGIKFPDSHKGKITYNQIQNSRMGPTGQEHQDAAQCWSIKGKPPVSDILIQGNTSVGIQGGFNCYNSADGGVLRVQLLDNTVIAGMAHAFTIGAGVDVLMKNNFAATWPGARDQAFFVVDRPEGILPASCGNRILAYGGKADASPAGLPATVGAPCK